MTRAGTRLDNPKGYPHYHTDDCGCCSNKENEKDIKERSNLQKLLDTTTFHSAIFLGEVQEYDPVSNHSMVGALPSVFPLNP
jgi:hypothetical protein